MINTVFSNVLIETKRLILRCFSPDDKEEFYRIIQDPIIYETLPEDHMYNREEVEELIDWFVSRYEENTLDSIPKVVLAIVLKGENLIIGDIGIGHYSMDESKMEIFYFINSKYWNQGIVSEAAEAFLRYVKENKLCKKLIGDVVPKNIASKKILLNNGFIKIEHTYKDSREMYERTF